MPGSSLFSPFGYEFSRKLPEPVIEVWSLKTVMGAVAYGWTQCSDEGTAIVVMTAASQPFLSKFLLGENGVPELPRQLGPPPPKLFLSARPFPFTAT